MPPYVKVGERKMKDSKVLTIKRGEKIIEVKTSIDVIVNTYVEEVI